ncbi:hypothetical protein ATO12_24720 [Aquimarina atlantica]|uniref:Uncharacterized protein n=1 Tax=Aquimarina atlantica TaxID=1317122 RepID=A0A023BQ75_9FLAO|nr:hypothetical protein [Aquimarina atlantica]EZH72141.1 hypothetical protein ATO12_24720 [Aquimarina atlantica]
MFMHYDQLCSTQKALVHRKLIARTKAPREVVYKVLALINPKVKIIDQDVLIMYYMMSKIEQRILEELRMKNEEY